MLAAFIAILVTTLTFTQTGFFALGLSGNNATYVVTLLVPIAATAMLLGVWFSVLMGVFSGATLALHALVQPLDFFEVIALSSVPSCVIFGVTGLLLGLFFSLALHRDPHGWRRHARITVICTFVSTLFSIAFYLNTAMQALVRLVLQQEALGTPDLAIEEVSLRMMGLGNPFTQLMIDAFLMVLCCITLERVVAGMGSDADGRPLRSTFNVWLLIAVSLGFMVTVSTSYVVVTEHERQLAEKDIEGELDYLAIQVEAQSQRGSLYEESASGGQSEALGEYQDIVQTHFSMHTLMDGYDKEDDGVVLIAKGADKQAVIVASDDPSIPEGTTLLEGLRIETVDAALDSLKDGLLRPTAYERFSTVDDAHFITAQLGYLTARRVEASNGDPYIIVIMQPAGMVFSDRNQIVVWMSLTALVVLVLVYLLVSRLLDRVVSNPIAHVNEQLDAICNGQLDTVVEARGSTELVGLSAGINTTVEALKEWIAETERRIDQELSTSRAIQESALPSLFPPFPDIEAFDLYASMTPAREVGGDFYDFFLVDENTLAFLIADVSGKGIPGALFMMAAKAELANHLKTGMYLVDAARMTNQRLCEGNDADMFVTVWVATLDYRTGLLTYVNAGHNPPLLRHDGTWTWLSQCSGLFMGSFEIARYKALQLTLEPGDALLLYTDGVNEAFSTADEQYGNDRLIAYLSSQPTHEPQELVTGLRDDVAAWAAGAPQSDDITILALEYHPNGRQ